MLNGVSVARRNRAEPAFVDHDLAQARFARLCAERGAVLGEGDRYANRGTRRRSRRRPTGLRLSSTRSPANGSTIMQCRRLSARAARGAPRPRDRHVVQAVEERDEVEVPALVARGVRDFEARIRTPASLARCAQSRWTARGSRSRRIPNSETPSPSGWCSRRDRNRRRRRGRRASSFSTTPSSAGSQRRADWRCSRRGRSAPCRERGRGDARPIPCLCRAEILLRALAHVKQILHDRIDAGQIDGAVRIGKAQRLLLGEVIFAGRGIVFDVAAGRLIAEPFADIALVRVRALRKLGRREPRLSPVAL